jgi:hypothetical protein
MIENPEDDTLESEDQSFRRTADENPDDFPATIRLEADQIVRGAEQYRVLNGGDFAPLELVTVYLEHDPAQQAAFHAQFIISEES